jgi:hypothetical protein
VADVFISYSQLDHARVRVIAERLTSLGYAIWWDQPRRGGQAFVEECERQLDAARVVLTVWTHHARNSTSVFAQSAHALDADKLLQLRLDVVAPAAPFDARAVADMSGERAEWGPLEDQLQRLVRGSPSPEPAARVAFPRPFATPAPVGAPKLLTGAALLTLLAYAGAVSATYTGAMTPEQLQFVLTGMIGVGGACAALAAHRLLIVRRAGG